MRTVPSNLSLADLVAKYAALTVAQRHRYNEAQTRKDFIEPLLAALGWDIHGAERDEVDVETNVSGGRADYAFKLNGVVRFYLEAKKLDDDLYNPEYAKQVITYAYNKGVPWAVLGNFAHLQVFNAEWETTDLNRARILNLTWQQYDAPDSPLRLLAREAFLNNELERHAQTYGGMRPRLPVEKSLFAQMRQWREVLFTQIALYRPDLSLAQVDEAIQRLLNRLIFIRTCEDRRIEEAKLRAALHQWEQHGHRPELVEMLREIWREYDVNYDSELFASALADTVFVEAMELKSILRGLYEPPRSLASYDFSVIDADVLGQVYEQYLGHVAQVAKERATQQQRQLELGLSVPLVQLEAKRAKRKEHGIYYTPKWVVEYIVRQTVGRYLQEHTYHEALNLKILDPACGSGSFLIRAFHTLLEYHAQVQGKPAAQLGQYERLGILTRNIYGVDLDQQAVEIARLNLLLRSLARRERLPYLSDNVRRGNSLISGGEAELRPYFGDAWREKEPFDWSKEFPEIMAQGGFDIIIGNPPWVESKRMKHEDKSYYEASFQSMKGQYDIFNGFVERAVSLLKNGGVLGFITPSRFVMNPDYGTFRKFLLDSTAILEIRDVGEHIFEGVEMPALILVLQRQPNRLKREAHLIEVNADRVDGERAIEHSYPVPQARFLHEGGFLFTIYQPPRVDALIQRVTAGSIRFGQVVCNARGVEIGKKSPLVTACSLGPDWVPFLAGEDIDRYTILSSRFIRLGDPSVDYKKPELYQGEKILVRKTGTGIRATLDTQGFYVIQVVYIFKPKRQDTNLRFLLGLLNSKLMAFYYFAKFGEKEKKAFPHLRQGPILELPIRLPDLDNPADKRRHDEIVSLVERMLELHRQRVAKGKVHDEERADIEREIARTDRQIDDLVYDLYGLTPEERRLVEEI